MKNCYKLEDYQKKVPTGCEQRPQFPGSEFYKMVSKCRQSIVLRDKTGGLTQNFSGVSIVEHNIATKSLGQPALVHSHLRDETTQKTILVAVSKEN